MRAICLRDVSIANIERSACASTTCPETPYGYGATSIGTTVSLRRFAIRGAATCGVLLAPGAEGSGPTSLDLESGLVAESAIGACVQVDGYDLDRLTNDVEYLDNETSLDSTALPVPAPVDPLRD